MHADFRYSGSLPNFGSHAFDLFRWVAGEVEWVQALPLDGGEPAVLAAAERGSTATFVQVRNPAADVFDAMFHAGESRFTITCLGEELVRAAPQPSRLFPGYVSLPAGDAGTEKGLEDAMLNAVNELVEHVESDAPLSCQGRDGVAALEIEAAVERSLASGTRSSPAPA